MARLTRKLVDDTKKYKKKIKIPRILDNEIIVRKCLYCKSDIALAHGEWYKFCDSKCSKKYWFNRKKDKHNTDMRKAKENYIYNRKYIKSPFEENV